MTAFNPFENATSDTSWVFACDVVLIPVAGASI